MPYELIWEPRGVVKRYRGLLTRRDLIEPVELIHGDPRFGELLFAINDLSEIEGIDVTAEDLDYVAALDIGAARTNPNIRVAVVTTSNAVAQLAAEYAATSGGAYPTQVFDTMAEARAWTARS